MLRAMWTRKPFWQLNSVPKTVRYVIEMCYLYKHCTLIFDVGSMHVGWISHHAWIPHQMWVCPVFTHNVYKYHMQLHCGFKLRVWHCILKWTCEPKFPWLLKQLAKEVELIENIIITNHVPSFSCKASSYCVGFGLCQDISITLYIRNNCILVPEVNHTCDSKSS